MVSNYQKGMFPIGRGQKEATSLTLALTPAV